MEQTLEIEMKHFRFARIFFFQAIENVIDNKILLKTKVFLKVSVIQVRLVLFAQIRLETTVQALISKQKYLEFI